MCPELGSVQALGREFVRMARERDAPSLERWLADAEGCETNEFREFTDGVRRDYAAVEAALAYEWSSGQVEGGNERSEGAPGLSSSSDRATGGPAPTCYAHGCYERRRTPARPTHPTRTPITNSFGEPLLLRILQHSPPKLIVPPFFIVLYAQTWAYGLTGLVPPVPSASSRIQLA